MEDRHEEEPDQEFWLSACKLLFALFIFFYVLPLFICVLLLNELHSAHFPKKTIKKTPKADPEKSKLAFMPNLTLQSEAKHKDKVSQGNCKILKRGKKEKTCAKKIKGAFESVNITKDERVIAKQDRLSKPATRGFQGPTEHVSRSRAYKQTATSQPRPLTTQRPLPKSHF